MNLTRRIIEGIHEVELQVTPEFRKSPGVKLKPEVRKDVLLSSMMTVENDSKAPISANNAVLIMMDAVSKDLSKDDVENILTNEIPVEWGYLEQHDTFTVWPKPHHNEAQFNAAIRWILKELKGSSVERDRAKGSFEKPLVRTDNVHTWWDFGPALTLVSKIYPTIKKINILGHASSVDARMDELMKMFSWLRDEHRGYKIVVHGGNANHQDMSDLQDAGMIDQFVPEGGEE